ncbi:MAG: UbiD family decarboxylase [Candidatus Eisenbacteria bacterium]|uniref:UbiD family decarboxylase n=1 Tax=Eiseniibacteriota bacterium TaxID=2212470 RepID=A0A849SWF6_UNCEI|nr:UbiD family decarboxylase [Candidatus Eisenbacteria bacterium]
MAPFRSLTDFLDHLDHHGDLKRVTREVDFAHEVTEIACREARAQGPALLFEKVRGARFPLAVNVLAATRRIEWALGRTAKSVGAEIEEIFHALPPRRISDLWKLRGSVPRLLASRPRTIGVAPVHDARGVTFDDLPLLKLWPRDGGRFVTFPLVFTEDPDTHKRNLGIYRMHVYDAKTSGMHWQIGKGGGFHFHTAESRGLPLGVAVAVGADPATLLAAVSPLPEGIDELAFAGFLRGSPTRLTRARTMDMLVPADAEFVIEGVVPAGERRTEGPFGDHFGHYSQSAPFPVFHVREITHRARPVFQASVVGKPPQEDLWMGEAIQDMFLGVLKVIHPEVVDLWAYFEAGFHNLLVVAVSNRFAREARKTALGLMGTGQLSLTKCIVLVDGDVNPRDRRAVFEALARNFDATEDFMLIPGVPLDTLDFTSYRMNLGSKMVLDAQSSPGGAAARAGGSSGRVAAVAPLDPPLEVPDPRAFADGITAWRLKWSGILAVQVAGAIGGDAATWEIEAAERAGDSSEPAGNDTVPATPGRAVVEALVRRPEYAAVRFIVAVSGDVDLDDDAIFLWGWFTRFDCARDVVPAHAETRGAWLTCRGPLGIDATWKRGYPEPVANLPEVIRAVDGWWGK